MVADRTTLDSILGTAAFTESFEAYNLTTGGAEAFTGIDRLDYLSIVNSQGPNLIAPGVVFTGTRLQWDAQNYFGAPSKEILFNANTLTIDFDASQPAFGLDLRDFTGYSMTATVTIYGSDDSTILTSISGMALTGTPIFFGYQDAAGIGKVLFAADNSTWSPIIDNLVFIAVPEPSLVSLMATGLLASAMVGRRRRAKRVLTV